MTNAGVLTTYSYNAADEMLTIAPTGSTTTTLSYDPNGNLSLENAGGLLTTYTWDGENRLITRADPTNGILTSTYFATGLRSSLVTPSTSTIYVRDGQNLLIEANSSGVTQAHYTDFPGQWGGLTSQRRSGTSSFYAFDLSSNARLLTSSSASQLATYLTDAFGLEKSITGSTTNSFLFSGEVGLYRDLANFLYARARYLSTVKGRWVSRDPKPNFSSIARVFGYARNSPLDLMDPSGQVALTPSYTPIPIMPGCEPWDQVKCDAACDLEAYTQSILRNEVCLNYLATCWYITPWELIWECSCNIDCFIKERFPCGVWPFPF
jgi:RHS repeat-associated protein